MLLRNYLCWYDKLIELQMIGKATSFTAPSEKLTRFFMGLAGKWGLRCTISNDNIPYYTKRNSILGISCNMHLRRILWLDWSPFCHVLNAWCVLRPRDLLLDGMVGCVLYTSSYRDYILHLLIFGRGMQLFWTLPPCCCVFSKLFYFKNVTQV